MSRQPRHLPLDQWPKMDRQAWAMALREPSIFDDDRAVASGWTARTREDAQRQYGYWLHYLMQRGPLTDCAPADRVTKPVLNDYVAHLRETISINSIVIYLDQLLLALRALAPQAGWRWVRDLKSRLARQRSGPVRDKRPRLRDSDVLVDLGIRLMAESLGALGETEPASRRERLRWATQYRDGLMIALLALRPLRRRTFSLIRIGRELVRVGDQWQLIFSPEQTKTHDDLSYRFPSSLRGHLETYLKVVRPIFPGTDAHPALWASKKSGPLTGGAIYKRILYWTESRLGVAINMHLFRDCAATTLANADMRGVNNAATLLGHKQLATTERFYIQADRRLAATAYQHILDARRRGKGTG